MLKTDVIVLESFVVWIVIPRDREFIGNNSGFLEVQAAAAH